jgi:GT2 family glycosyltransferase
MTPCPKVAAIVLSWNRRDEVLNTVGLLMQDDYPNLDVIVVDNASTDGTVAALMSAHPQVRVLALPHNLGISGRDVGVVNTNADIVAFFDDDSAPDPGAIVRMAALFAANPGVGIIPFGVYGGAHATEYMADLTPSQMIGYVASGVGLRREAIVAAGFSDRDFFWGAEEWDLAIRILNRGYGIAFDPAIRAHHRTSVLHRSYQRWRRLTTRNETWMAIKYFPPARIPLLICRVLFNNINRSRLDGVPPWYAIRGAAAALRHWRTAWQKRESIRPEILARYERYYPPFHTISLLLRASVGRRLPADTPFIMYRILFWKADIVRREDGGVPLMIQKGAPQ